MRRLSSPGALTVTKQTAPAPAGLHSTRQKFALLIALPPSLSSSLIAGFSPATRTFGAGGLAVDSCACIVAGAKAKAAKAAAPSIVCIEKVISLKLNVKG